MTLFDGRPADVRRDREPGWITRPRTVARFLDGRQPAVVVLVGQEMRTEGRRDAS